MARCPICGKNYADTVRVCSTCGARLAGSNASSTRESVPVQGNGYQQPAAQMPPVQRKPVKQNAGVFNIIFSAIIPLYGIIMYFSWKKTRPKAAKQVLIAALIALALAVIVQIPTVSRPDTNTLMSSPAPTIPTFSISSHSPTLSPVTLPIRRNWRQEIRQPLTSFLTMWAWPWNQAFPIRPVMSPA